MKAIVYEKYGEAAVLKLREVEKPAPKKDEVLIKIIATSVSAADWRLRKADPFLARIFNGLFKPKKVKILGAELPGIVEEIGQNVKSFKKGDSVFAYSIPKFGGYAEYTCFKEKDLIAPKPSNMSFEEAATTPLGSLTALILLRKAKISSQKKVMIYGASGSVGTFAVQLAKYFGAEVTAVCSTKNIDLVKSLGADNVIDYTNTDISTLNAPFDIVFDAVGKLSKSQHSKTLHTNGNVVSVKSQTRPSKDDLLFIKNVVESGGLFSFIDRSYQIEDIREAHLYAEQFRKRGNVAVSVFSANNYTLNQTSVV